MNSLIEYLLSFIPKNINKPKPPPTQQEIDNDILNKYISNTERCIHITIPDCIKQIIHKFIPSYTAYAIGRNKFGHFGLCHNEPIDEFIPLPQLSKIISSSSNIYGNNERIIIKNLHKEIFASGNNYFGELGIPITNECSYNFKKLQIPFTDNTDQVDIISEGVLNEITFITTVNNKIFCCGRGINYNNNAQSSWDEFPSYFLNDKTDKIIDIKCSYKHVLFLTKFGKVWSFGDNDLGQCGQSSLMIHFDKPVLIICLPECIKKINVGQWHNLALDKNGKLWVFGSNHCGQLGFHSFDNNLDEFEHNGYMDEDDYGVVFQPQLNPWLDDINIIDIECGAQHSLCIDENGNCYTFGNNQLGQIGNYQIGPSVFRPYKVEDIDKVIQGKCGWNHNVLLTENNDVICFGSNSFKQSSPLLFDEEEITKVTEPHILCKEMELRLMNGVNDEIDYVFAESFSTMVIVKNKICY